MIAGLSASVNWWGLLVGGRYEEFVRTRVRHLVSGIYAEQLVGSFVRLLLLPREKAGATAGNLQFKEEGSSRALGGLCS